MLALSLFVTRPATPAEPSPAAHIGSRLELLVDDWLIDSRRDLSFQLHRPVRAETVLQPEQPWEGTNLGHVSILRDGERYRMYYRGYHNPGFSWSENIVTCYAESRDGIHWIKPNLGLVEWEGSKDNIIITRGQRGAYLTPFRDPRPGVPQGQRYKSLAGNPRVPWSRPTASIGLCYGSGPCCRGHDLEFLFGIPGARRSWPMYAPGVPTAMAGDCAASLWPPRPIFSPGVIRNCSTSVLCRMHIFIGTRHCPTFARPSLLGISYAAGGIP